MKSFELTDRDCEARLDKDCWIVPHDGILFRAESGIVKLVGLGTGLLGSAYVAPSYYGGSPIFWHSREA